MIPTKPDADPLSEEKMYGWLFHNLADQLADVKLRANELMRKALERGLDPAEFEADYSLVELGLAEETNVVGIGGGEDFIYFDPDTV